MKRRILVGSLLALGLLAVGSYRLNRAFAYGIPSSNTLVFSAQLLSNNLPMGGSHTIQLQTFVTGTSSPTVCQTTSSTVVLANGVFTMVMDPTCVTAVHTYPNLAVTITVDNVILGSIALAAVPYAVEADTASNFSPDGGIAAIATPRHTYTVWGQQTCGANTPLVTGYLGAYGVQLSSSSSAGVPLLGGDAMCLSPIFGGTFGATSANNVFVTRSYSKTGATADTCESMATGQSVGCAVCSGFGYTLWGTTTCPGSDPVVYTGHAAGLSSTAGNGGQWTAGPVCLNDAAPGTWNDWNANCQPFHAAGASGNPYAQQLGGGGGGLTCVVCL